MMHSNRYSLISVAATAILTGALFIAPAFAPLSAGAQTDDYGTPGGGDVASYCPSLMVTMQWGSRDSSTGGQVSELQKFLAGYYDIDPEELVTGYFGRITQSYVQRFQAEQGLPTFGIVGSLTRARIAAVCSGGSGGGGSVSFSATPVSGAAPLTVTFSANLQVYASSGSGDIVLDFGDGQIGTLCRPGFSGVSACAAWSGPHTYSAAGTYIAHLIKKGGTCSINGVASFCGAPDQTIGTVMIVVSGTGSGPTFSATPTSGAAPLAVVFKTNVSGSTVYFGDGTSAIVQQDCATGSSGTACSTGSYFTSHTYAQSGTYTATLHGTFCPSSSAACAQVMAPLTSVVITVLGASTGTPTITGVSGPTTLAVGQSGTWTVSASDSSNSSLSYSVRWGDETALDSLQSIAGGSAVFVQSATFTHAYSKAGTYAPHFTVKNSAGKTAETSMSVQVGGSPASGNLSVTPSSGVAPLSVTFTGTLGSCASGTLTLLFGDGQSATVVPDSACVSTIHSTHTYLSAGTYTASLYGPGGCITSSGGGIACYDQNLIGTAVVIVTDSIIGGGGTTCPSGYYLSIIGSCLPSTTQIPGGGQVTLPSCAAGYYMTLGNGCQPKTDSTTSASTAVASCSAGFYMALSGCMPLPAGSCATTWGSRLVGNNGAVSMQPYFTNGVYTGSDIRYLCQSGTWRTQGYCGDASGPACQKP